MEGFFFFKQLLIILGFSIPVIYIFHKIKLPSIIGFLITDFMHISCGCWGRAGDATERQPVNFCRLYSDAQLFGLDLKDSERPQRRRLATGKNFHRCYSVSGYNGRADDAPDTISSRY